MKDKIVLKWSKQEKDWIFYYPDRIGQSMTALFFEMIKIEENISFHKKEINEYGKIVDKSCVQNLKQFLTERGYDYTTFKITCNKNESKRNTTENS